jgi:hypothetical protein
VAPDRCRSLLVATLGFLMLHTSDKRLPPSLAALHSWLDNWRGIGHIVVGMERLGYVVSLKKWRDGGWTATFNRDVMLSSEGFGSGSTPWLATQRAA